MMIELLKEDNYERKLILWEQICPLINENDLRLISNPYLLGYGNPKADTIIFGMEHAIDFFDVYQPNVHKRLFFEENVNSCWQWQKIIKENHDWDTNIEKSPYPYLNAISSKIYDPIRHKLTGTHTWGIYSKIVALQKGHSIDQWNTYHASKSENESISGNLFQSEINHIPARKMEGTGLIEKRKEFLKSNFFKSFNKTIVSGKSYIKDYGLIEELFDVSFSSDGYFDVSNSGKKRLAYTLFENKERKLVLTSQLSGNARWSNKGLENLIGLIEGNEKASSNNKAMSINKVDQTSVSNTMKGSSGNDEIKNNRDLIIHVTLEARRIVEDLGLSNKIRIVRAGEVRKGNTCHVYARPIIESDPNTQLVTSGSKHRQDENTLLTDKVVILSELRSKIITQSKKMGL